MSSRSDRFIIAASRDYEPAYEQLDGEHGVLSGALLKALDAEQVPDRQWLTSQKLGYMVDEQLKAYYTQTNIPQHHQINYPRESIKLIQGTGKGLSANQQSEPQKTKERKIPFVLPQLDVSTFTGRDEELKNK